MINLDLFDLPSIRERVRMGIATSDDCERVLRVLDRLMPELAGHETDLSSMSLWECRLAAMGEEPAQDKNEELEEAIEEARAAASELESAAAALRRVAQRSRVAA